MHNNRELPQWLGYSCYHVKALQAIIVPISKKQKEKAHMTVLTASKPTLYDFVLVEGKLGKGTTTMPFSFIL